MATVRSSELLAKLEDLNLILREKASLAWAYGAFSGAIRTACDIQIDGRWGAGMQRLTWKKLTEIYCCEWNLTTVDLQERSTWGSAMRSAMHAVSQLAGKGPTDVDGAPAPAH